MTTKRIEYDAAAKRIKVYRSFPKAKTLVPNEELKTWTSVLKSGQDDQGRSVKSVRYVFDDAATAKYNQQPLTFSGLETYVTDGGRETPLGDDPNFSVREDFGIDGGE